MKEPYGEILARYAGPEPRADDGNVVGVATAGVRLGPDTESRKCIFLCADPLVSGEGNTKRSLWRDRAGTTGSTTWSMGGNFKRENQEAPLVCRRKSPTAVREPL